MQDMFQGMSGGGAPQPGTDLLQDVQLDKIDFEWVEKCNKISHLKKAIKLIEKDGDYYPDLKKACVDRITKLDPKQAPKNFNNNVPQDIKKKLDKEIYNWEEDLEKKEQQKQTRKKNQQIFGEDEEDETIDKEQEIEELNKRKAENEKNKGNEALKSKDFDEAIQYYTKSIQYNPTLAASYCNRALVYLKQKKYDECIKDANKAISLDANYIKAYHRRGKAKQAQKKFGEAYTDFRFIMDRDPDNAVNADLQEVISQMKQNEGENNKGFKRVQIVEEDDSEEDEEENNEENNKDQKNSLTEDPEVITGVTKDEFGKISAKIDAKKEKAVQMIKDGMYEDAVKILRQCVNDIEEIGPHREDPTKSEFQAKRCSYLNNMCLCYKQLDHNKDVIKYASIVIEQKQILSKDILVKAYLRRALALEKLEKFRSAKYDFVSVKELDPSNLQASQGLQRTIPHQQEELEEETIQHKEKLQKQKEEEQQKKEQENKVVIQEENEEKEKQQKEENQHNNNQVKKEEKQQEKQQEKKENSLESVQDLEKLKNQGNNLFKNKDLEGALQIFQQGVHTLETKFKKSLKQGDGETTKIYLQFMTNKALCELNLQKFEAVLRTTDKVLSIEPNNSKAIYRNALASKYIGFEFLKKSETVDSENSKDKKQILKSAQKNYESARKELERLQKLEPTNNKVKTEISEIVKSCVEIKLQINSIDIENTKVQNENKSQQQQQEQSQQYDPEVIKQQENVESKNNKVDSEYLNDVAKSAMDQILDQLVNSNDLPEMPSIFEKNVSSFKKKPERLFEYLQKFSAENIKKIYNKKDIAPDFMMVLIESIKNNGQNISKEKSVELIQGISETNKFNLCAMCLSKKEKQIIRELFESLQILDKYKTVFKL